MALADPTSENLSRVLDIARATLDGEFARANRLDEKARGQATSAASWFAVTQTVVAIAVAANSGTGWVVGLSFGFGLQATSLVFLLYHAADVWKLRERTEVGQATLEAMKNSISEPVVDFGQKTIDFYAGILAQAQAANKDRGEALETAQCWWSPVLILGLVEIGLALISRIT